jgi:hypothetical protein
LYKAKHKALPFMYQILDKDTISEEILLYLLTAKRDFKTKSCLTKIVNCILYKLKTGCQWHSYLLKYYFSEVLLSSQAFWTFSNSTKTELYNHINRRKLHLDLSSAYIDGSMQKLYAGKGVKKVTHQGRKNEIDIFT